MLSQCGRLLCLGAVLAILASCGGSNTNGTLLLRSNQSKFAFTANELTADISGYAVDDSTGALTPLAGFPIHSGVNPVAIAVDPLGHFAYVADINLGVLRVYAIDATSGMLQELLSSPYAAGNQPQAVVVHPSGKYVYVASRSSNAVFGFSVDSNTGALAPIQGSPYAAGT